MAILIASKCFYGSIHDSACQVFKMPIETGDIEIKHHSFGIIVTVLSGEHKGDYDAWIEGESWHFLRA